MTQSFVYYRIKYQETKSRVGKYSEKYSPFIHHKNFMKLYKRRIWTFQLITWVDYGVGRRRMGFISQHDVLRFLFSIASGRTLRPTQSRTDTADLPSERGKEVKLLRCAADNPPPLHAVPTSACEDLYLYYPTRLTCVMLISRQGITYLISIVEC